jgi:3-phosphoshikimate 1-carboxyvinyltransferase
MSYPPRLTLTPFATLDAALDVPGSKSLTNRALILAALAEGTSTLTGGLIADDSEVMVRALRQLGIGVEVDGTSYTVAGRGGEIPAAGADLDLKLSGTSIRFLTAVTALGRGRFVLDGNARMRERPIQDLLNALTPLGARLGTLYETGCPPVVVEASGLVGGTTRVAGDSSSQYLSALLMVAPYAEGPVEIEVVGELLSKPFLDMTLALMADFGVEVAREGYTHFRVEPGRYRALSYRIEGDAMAAGYFWAAAAVTGGTVRIGNVGSDSVQGDRRLADVLAAMGCEVRWGAHETRVTGPSDGRLRGGTFDLNDMPDQAQTLAVVALFADAAVRIENIWNLRIKETDRLSAMATELQKFGVRAIEERDALTVVPLEQSPGPVEVATYDDHRMAMAFAVAGARLDGVTLLDPGCVAKTYPRFFEDWQGLRDAETSSSSG